MVAGLLLLPALAFAAEPVSPSQTETKAPALTPAAMLEQLIASPGYQKFLADLVNSEEPAALRRVCPTVELTNGLAYSIIETPTFSAHAAGDKLESGVWMSVAQVDRCGRPARRRVLIRFDTTLKRFRALALVPGDFPGNLALERDTYRAIVPEAATVAACSDPHRVSVLDTRELVPLTHAGGREVWTLIACDKWVAVTVTFTPAADGRHMDIRGSDYTLIAPPAAAAK